MITIDSMTQYVYGSYIIYYTNGAIALGHIIYNFGYVPSLKDIQNEIKRCKELEIPIADITILNIEFLTEDAYNILSKH